MKHLSQHEIDKIISNVEATLAIEGLEQSEFSEEICRRYLKGELSAEQVIQMINEIELRKKDET